MRGYSNGPARLAAIVTLVVAALAAVVILLPGRESADTADLGVGAQQASGAQQGGASRGDAGHGSGDPFQMAEKYLRTRRGVVAAAAEDLRTGRTWTLGGGAPPEAEASVVKLDILQALLARSPRGLPASQRALARKMITVSDNAAATALWHAAGGAAGIGAYNAAAGLSRTRLSSCVRCPGFAWPGWGLSTTTPADQLALLRQLAGPGLLSHAARGYALSLLENVTRSQRWGVSGGVPAGARVALKNGWLPLASPAGGGSGAGWQVNSVGWVSGDGRDYLLAVFSARNPSERYGVATVSRIGALTWSALGLWRALGL